MCGLASTMVDSGLHDRTDYPVVIMLSYYYYYYYYCCAAVQFILGRYPRSLLKMSKDPGSNLAKTMCVGVFLASGAGGEHLVVW